MTVRRHAEAIAKLMTIVANAPNYSCAAILSRSEAAFGSVQEPEIIEESELALELEKPLNLLGGFGGATRLWGEFNGYDCTRYWQANNGQ